MGTRREGREAAVQFLYQLDSNATPFEELFPIFWELRSGVDGKDIVPALTRVFTEDLARGVLAHREEIDVKIQSYTQNFELRRIAVVDRNILRLGIYEMTHSNEVPPVVVINECIEIAKRFAGEDSGRFINGVLDRYRKELPKPAREAIIPRGAHAAPGYPQVPVEYRPSGGGEPA